MKDFKDPLRKCSHCEGCGCPKCLSTGFNISKLIKEYNKLFAGFLKHEYELTIENYYSLPVVEQRSVSEYIHDYIKRYNLGNNE